LCEIEKIVMCNYHDHILVFKRDNYEILLYFDLYVLINFILREFSYALLVDSKNK